MDASELEAAQLTETQQAVKARSAETANMVAAGLIGGKPARRDGEFVDLRQGDETTRTDAVGHANARTMRSQGAFLAAFAELGRVDLAAKTAGIARQTHYEWMKNDPEYPALFAEAEQLAAQLLMDEAVRRACHGWEEPTTVAGEKVMVRKYSDRLMERLLEARFPGNFARGNRFVDDKGKDRDLIPLSAIDKLMAQADQRDKETA